MTDKVDGTSDSFAQRQDQLGLRIQGLRRSPGPGGRSPVAEQVDGEDSMAILQGFGERGPLAIGAHRAMNQNDRLTLSIVGVIDLELSLREDRHATFLRSARRRRRGTSAGRSFEDSIGP